MKELPLHCYWSSLIRTQDAVKKGSMTHSDDPFRPFLYSMDNTMARQSLDSSERTDWLAVQQTDRQTDKEIQKERKERGLKNTQKEETISNYVFCCLIRRSAWSLSPLFWFSPFID